MVATLNGASVLITDTRLSQKVKNIAPLQFNNTSSTDLKLIEVKMTKGYLHSNVYSSITTAQKMGQ